MGRGTIEDDLDWGAGDAPTGGTGQIHQGVLAVRESPKALLIRTADGQERWVPKGQIHADSEVFKSGHRGTLVVTEWFAARWNDDEKPTRVEEAAVFSDVVCLRETARAIVVRIGADGEEIMIPKSQVMDNSEVRMDGDFGELRITAWIAKQKNLA